MWSRILTSWRRLWGQKSANDMEAVKAILKLTGIPFEMTDSSEESSIEECLDTVIVLTDSVGDPEEFGLRRQCLLFFTREGKFKNEIWVTP